MRENNKKIALCDLDDVLNDFNPNWINHYNGKYNQTLTEEDITEWDIHKFVLPNINIFDEFIYVENSHFFRNMGVQQYAQEGTKELMKYYNLYVVSASHFTTVADKAEFLLEHYSHIPIKNFIPCYNKFMIKGDLLIDDGLHNFIGFEGKKILFDKPWNRNYKDYKEDDIDIENIYVMKNWSSEEVERLLGHIL